MKGYLVKSILGLTLTTAVVGGTIYGVNRYNDSKSVATGIEATEEFALNDVHNEEALTDADELELLTLQKAEEDAEVTDEDAVMEETEETTEEDAEVTEDTEDADKEEDKKPSTDEKEETKAETTTETVETPTETPSEQPSETVEQPTQATTTETVAETPAPQTQATEQTQTAESVQPTAWSSPFAFMVVDNPQNDSERLHNEMYSASSQEEFERLQEELANTAFDINGNVVDPSMITTEEPTDTVTEVIE